MIQGLLLKDKLFVVMNTLNILVSY